MNRVSNVNTEGKKHSRKKTVTHKIPLAAFCLALILLCGIGGTLAYLVSSTGPVTNTFVAAKVDNKIDETYENNIKSSIKVENKGNVDIFVRVKLVSYRVNDSGDHIGGDAPIDEFELNVADWFEHNGCYYYRHPLEAGSFTDDLIITERDEGIVLKEYTDADGGKQVIEVMSEAIQTEPGTAVEEAWSGITVVNGELALKGTN